MKYRRLEAYRMVVAAALAFAAAGARSEVRVNEVMASNGSTIATKGGDYADWVELYNSGSEAVDVSGWRLSDSPTKAWSKWHALPDGTVIPADGYLLVWADGYDKVIDGEVHVDIGFSASGESVALASSEGNIVSTFDYPAQLKDVSYGYDANGALTFFETPTPGASNGAASGGVTPAVGFSEARGYKTAPFTLTLTPAAPTALPVYYTLDGTSPADSATRVAYTGPFEVSKTTVVRAAAVDPDATRIEVSTATYIFLSDVLAQGRDGAVPTGFPDETVTDIVGHNDTFKQWLWYGFDTRFFAAGDAERFAKGFEDIGTISLVTDPSNLFDRVNGIYVNAQATKEGGREWERPANIEMIDPAGDHAKEFSVPAGIRLRGAYSRNPFFPKHSFRVFMRGEYGMPKLKFPLLGELSDRIEFEKFDIRADQNHAWPNEIGNQFDQPQNATYVNDIFARDQQDESGRPATKGKPYHLFINGQYWGLYQTQERLAEDYTVEKFGGTKDDWDIVSVDSSGVSASAGTADAYLAFRDITLKEGYGPDHPNNYNRVRGLDANGVRDEQLPVYLDVKNLADYVILAHWTADVDSPVNPVIMAVNNLRMAYRRGPKGEGFKFFRHDNEHCLFQSFRNYNFTDANLNDSILRSWCDGPAVNPVRWGTERNDEGIDFASAGVDRGGVANFTNNEAGFNPFLLHDRLEANADYKIAFADRVKRLCFGDGVLTPERSATIFRARMKEIDNAIVAESARWGCYVKPEWWGGENRFTRETWLNACNRVLTDFIPQRTGYLVGYYREAGWYPSFDAPEASRTEGTLEVGEKLSLTAAEGKKIYYTTDGSDPRASGGGLAANAQTYTGAIAPSAAVLTVFARAYDESTGEWSAKTEVELNAELAESVSETDVGRNLRFLEVLSCTADADGNGDDERIVLTNLSATATLDLGGVRITSEKTGKGELSLDLTLAAGTTLAPNGALTLTKGGDWPLGYITNGDIDLHLLDAEGALIQAGHIEDSWFGGAADGTGLAYVAAVFDRIVDTESDWRCESSGEDPEDDPDPVEPLGTTYVATKWSEFKAATNNLLLGVRPVLEDAGNTNSAHEAYINLNGNWDAHIEYLTDGKADVSKSGLTYYSVRDDAKISWHLAKASTIEEFRFYSGWDDNGRAGLAVARIEVKVAGVDVWRELDDTTFNWCSTYTDGNTISTDPAKVFDDQDKRARYVRIYPANGKPFAENVTDIRVDFGRQDNYWDGYAEIEALGKAAPAPAEPEAPAVGGISVTADGRIEIDVSNGRAGFTYGYLFAETLEGLATAEPVWLTDPVAADGRLLLECGRTSPSGFYKVIVK